MPELRVDEMKDLYKAIEEVRPRVTGWCSAEKARALADAVVETKPAVTVELGVWAGRSLVALALAHDFLEHGHCYGVDAWSPEAALHGVEETENREWWAARDYVTIYRGCSDLLFECHLVERCTLLRLTSEQAAPIWSSIGLIHIDGNHSEMSSTRDAMTYLPKIVPGGYVFFDDIDWSSTRPAVRLVEEQCDKVGEIVSNPGGVCGVYRKR